MSMDPRIEPVPTGCTCDFSSGTRGMDRCSHCGGTGSRLIILVKSKAFYFPNTEGGHAEALAKLAEGKKS